MATSSESERDAKLDQRGFRFAEFDLLAKYLPEYDSARRTIAAMVYTPEETELPVKFREMISASILAYRGYPTIEMHFRRAIREGATMRELIETMQCAALAGGSPTLHFALGYLAKIEDDIEAARPV